MQHDNTAQQSKAERKARQIEVTLVNHNPAIDRVLEACRRIDWRQAQQAKHEEVEEYA